MEQLERFSEIRLAPAHGDARKAASQKDDGAQKLAERRAHRGRRFEGDESPQLLHQVGNELVEPAKVSHRPHLSGDISRWVFLGHCAEAAQHGASRPQRGFGGLGDEQAAPASHVAHGRVAQRTRAGLRRGVRPLERRSRGIPRLQ